MHDGEYEEAIWHYDQALKLDSNFKEARNNKALALKAMGRVQDACNEYNTILQRDQKSVVAMIHVAECLSDLQQHRQALEMASTALKLAPENALAIVCMGLLLINAGKGSEG